MSKPRFKAQEQTVTNNLINTMKKMKATNLKVNRDLLKGDVDIIFDRGGKRYVFRCSTYDLQLDNYRASQLCIEYLYRALEAYGVSSTEEGLFDRVFDNFFLGWEARPDDDVLMIGDQSAWYEILGVKPDAEKKVVINAYKSLAKIHHPDAGGEKETFIKLRKAYEEGMEVT